MGYIIGRAAAIHGGHSSAQLVQPKAAVIGKCKASLMGPPNKGHRDPESHCGYKIVRRDRDPELSGLWFFIQTQKEINYSFDKNREQQASSHKLQAPSCKRQASSHKRQAP